MSIKYNESLKTITLNTKSTTYMMKIGNLNYLNHLYYGPSLEDEDLDYQIDGKLVRGGDDLMQFGLMPLDSAAHPMEMFFHPEKEFELFGDYDSHLYVLKAVE